ncbi:MAG: periplasmic chaperone, partial [Verrucomicrobiales bacterium]|nr:periplasmic chaperone [Verrucomicrobiales bacterium]
GGLIAAALCFATAAHAEMKIATIDLRKVFDNYYKTKQADEILKKEADDVQKERKGIVDQYKKLEDDWKGLISRANDQALSSEERDKAKQQAERKLVELRETEQAVNDYDRVAQQKLFEKKKLKWDAIVTEIRQVVNTKSKSAGYNMVFDSSGDTMNNTPMVLYTDGQNDVTDMILKELNAMAPAATKADSTSDAKTGSGLVKPVGK